VAEVSPPLIRQDLRRTATARILRCPDAVEDAVQASPSHHVQRVPVLANIHTTIDAPTTTRHANTIIYSYPVPAQERKEKEDIQKVIRSGSNLRLYTIHVV